VEREGHEQYSFDLAEGGSNFLFGVIQVAAAVQR
jgi:hypothetical protein